MSAAGHHAKNNTTDGANIDEAFVDNGGTTVLTYAGLTVFDATGRTFPARFEPAPEGLRLAIEECGAKYPLTIDPIAQQAYLKASNTGAGDALFSVAVAFLATIVPAARAARLNPVEALRYE